MITRTSAVGVALALLLPLAGCGGSTSPGTGLSVSQALEQAKKKFDETSSVHLVLSTDSVPTSGDAVLGADGVLTHQPAFKGQVTAVLGGFNAVVPIISVGGKVYAKILSPTYHEIDPAEYSAPDPADFVDNEKGISTLLLQLKGAEKTGQKREGEQVLTTYTGTLAGSLVSPIIPSADDKGTYKTVVGIDSGGRVVTLRITGDFFTASGQVSYDLKLDGYGKSVTIAAP